MKKIYEENGRRMVYAEQDGIKITAIVIDKEGTIVDKDKLMTFEYVINGKTVCHEAYPDVDEKYKITFLSAQFPYAQASKKFNEACEKK